MNRRCHIRVREETREKDNRCNPTQTSMLRPVNRVDVDALLHHLPQWAHITQPLHDRDDFLHREVDFGLGGKATDTEPQRRMRHVLGGTWKS